MKGKEIIRELQEMGCSKQTCRLARIQIATGNKVFTISELISNGQNLFEALIHIVHENDKHKLFGYDIYCLKEPSFEQQIIDGVDTKILLSQFRDFNWNSPCFNLDFASCFGIDRKQKLKAEALINTKEQLRCYNSKGAEIAEYIDALFIENSEYGRTSDLQYTKLNIDNGKLLLCSCRSQFSKMTLKNAIQSDLLKESLKRFQKVHSLLSSKSNNYRR